MLVLLQILSTVSMVTNSSSEDTTSITNDNAGLKELYVTGGGVLDLGVLGQPDYICMPNCWAMKIHK